MTDPAPYRPRPYEGELQALSDVELELRAARVLLASRGRVCAIWEALGKAWQVLPIATFGSGWLLQPVAARVLPEAVEFALGLSFVVFGCGLGVVRMRKVNVLRKLGFGLEGLEPIERELERREQS